MPALCAGGSKGGEGMTPRKPRIPGDTFIGGTTVSDLKEAEALAAALESLKPSLPDAARKALAVLRDVEWVKEHPDEPCCCQVCDRYQPHGHTDGCALAEAIRELGEVL